MEKQRESNTETQQKTKKHCQNTISHHDEQQQTNSNQKDSNKLSKKYNLNTNQPPVTPLPNELTLLCAELSFWIYELSDPNHPIPKPIEFKENDSFRWHYKKIIETKGTQISQWAFLQFSGQPKNAYLVFKGTDPDKIFGTISSHNKNIDKHQKHSDTHSDVMADTSLIPMPIWCREDAKNTNNKMDRHQSFGLCKEENSEEIKEEIDEDKHEWFCLFVFCVFFSNLVSISEIIITPLQKIKAILWT